MAITTYGELQTAIGDFLNRDDLTNITPTFIDLAEAEFQRKIRHWRMEETYTANTTSGTSTVALPSDWLQTVRFSVTTTSETVLEPINAGNLLRRRQNSSGATGRPEYYALVDNAFELHPTPDDTYALKLIYFERIPVLADDNTTNWLLDNHPDVYLYGALAHSAPYLKDDPRIELWKTLYGVALQAVVEEDYLARWAPEMVSSRHFIQPTKAALTRDVEQ